ncbi:MAG: hypothetical protein IKE29_07620 [Paenibacillus sp.]|uniref:hypothetical protein n=1 Tax=Paenibacillus sp. TaxID=58172 RepID=UPI0025D86218|nr:hypothetical protein [Paenibacillus sp.]MBR2564476.1 hypothetical protein [Paenibacillus sp.]
MKKSTRNKGFTLSLLIGLMTIMLVACGKPLTEKLYSESVVQEIKDSTEITQEDKDLFGKAVLYSIGSNTDLSSKTVGQIIADEKLRQLKIEEEEKKRQEEIKRKQEEAEAKKQSVLKLLDESIQVGLIKKSVTLKDTNKWIFSDVVHMTLDLKNVGEKDVKGFQGVITFKDMFDNDIKSLNVKYDQPIKTGKSTSYEGSFEINQFMDEDIELRDTPLEKIKVEFEMDQIIFADGDPVKRSDIE